MVVNPCAPLDIISPVLLLLVSRQQWKVTEGQALANGTRMPGKGGTVRSNE